MIKKIWNGITAFFSNPRNVFWLGMFIAILATSLEVFRGRNTNYFDYQDSTRMFWEGISPYTLEYALANSIYFLYSPVFNIIFAPIYFLPWWLGPFVWNIGNYLLFYFAIRTLPEKYDPYKHKIFLFLLPVLLQAIFCYQHNTIVAYIYIYAYSLLERNKGFWAVLLIMISACTKVYGAAELALLFCYPKMWRNFGYAILCGAALICLPLLNPNFDNPFMLYQQMFDMIASHHSDSDFIGILFARGLKPFLLPNYRIVQIVVFAILGLIFFSSYKKWSTFSFRAQALAVVTGFMILFSDCPETHTYLIALPAYAMVFFIREQKTKFDWVIFWLLVFNFGIIPTDVLCPAWLHEWIHQTLWLDVYTFFIAWLRIIWWAIERNSITSSAFGNMKGKMAMALLMLFLTMPSFAQEKSKTWVGTKVYTVNGVTFRMKCVQGGSFVMGSKTADDDYTASDETPHKVVLSNYYIGETEVTQALWEAVMGKNRSRIKGADHPVDYVTYEDCQRFIARLNSLAHSSFRLPTEAEWEYAACGGRYSRHTLYSGSDSITDVAWQMSECSDWQHRPVAQKKPNELGLYDMSGNVWEWCEDFYGPYTSNRRSSSFHVIRGGAFNCLPKFCRNTNRYMYDTRRRNRFVGLRLALSRK